MKRYNTIPDGRQLGGSVRSGIFDKEGIKYRRRSTHSQAAAIQFDGVNDYGYQSHCWKDCVEKKNDGVRNFLRCTGYGGLVSLTDTSQEFSLTSRSAQTLKFVGTIENFLTQMSMFSYGGLTTGSVLTNGKVEIELQGTNSLRISGNTVLSANTVYNIIIRINNSISGGTQRVVGDADIFIGGVKETKGTTATGLSTSTGSFLYRGAYSSTQNRRKGDMYSLTVWNRALSDGECASEGASNFAVVNTDCLRCRDANNTTRELGRSITRTNYPITGLVTKSSDANGNYLFFNGNRDGAALTGQVSSIGLTTTTGFSDLTSFTMKCMFQLNTAPANNASGLFGSNFDCCLAVNGTAGGRVYGGVRNGATTLDANSNISLNTVYHVFLNYDANTQKFYFYIGTDSSNLALINAGGTTIPGAFTVNELILGDNAILGGNVTSCQRRIYHGRMYYKSLSFAEMQADVDLGNTIPTDPTIFAELRPEGMVDTNLLTNSDNLAHGDWVVGANTTRTVNYGTAPNGTNTSCRIQFSAGLNVVGNRFDQLRTTGQLGLSGGELAGKTMQQKVFVRSAVAGQKFRLKMTHSLVSDYFSSDFTATTERREYTYAPAFTSATNGTGIQGGVVQASDGSAADIEIWNPEAFYIAEQLLDYACSIGYIGRFSDIVLCCYGKMYNDGTNVSNSNTMISIPGRYCHIRDTNNLIQFRRETKRASASAASPTGQGNRKEYFYAFRSYISGLDIIHETRVNGELKGSSTARFYPSSFYANFTLNSSGLPAQMSLRGMRLYKGSITPIQMAKLEYFEPTGLAKILEFSADMKDVGTSRKSVIDKVNLNRLTIVNGGGDVGYTYNNL